MIRNFERVKSQLNDLAEALNKFNSEAVQLKIIELLLGGTEKAEVVEKVEKAAQVAEVAEVQATPPAEKRKKPGRPSKKENVEKETKSRTPRKRITDRPGPSTILKSLLETDFFTEKRTIGDIVQHCAEVHKYEYKSTDLSGTLAKLAKDGTLGRDKNPESNQFEYIIK
jgi:hypothetical protein